MVHCHATHVFTPELCVLDDLTFEQQIEKHHDLNIRKRFQNIQFNNRRN